MEAHGQHALAPAAVSKLQNFTPAAGVSVSSSHTPRHAASPMDRLLSRMLVCR